MNSMTDNSPEPRDVAALTQLLDLMENFGSNEQRARYLLSCNWMRDRDLAMVALGRKFAAHAATVQARVLDAAGVSA